MSFRSRLVFALVGATLALGACAPNFRLRDFAGSNERLFEAGLREYRQGRWENAIAAFERLTLDLPARDTLLPLANFYLGKAHYRRKEFLLAGQAFSRLAESFPNDTLADDALLWTARSYGRLWRKPTLDAQYGQTAISTYRLLPTLFPESPLRPEAERQAARLEDWMARKAFENGMHYFRRKAYDSSIIYFRGVLEQYGSTPTAREAALKLHDAYTAIRYATEASELCDSMRSNYGGDEGVMARCGAARAPAPAVADTAVTPPAGTTPR